MSNFVEMLYEIDEYELAATVEAQKNQGHEGVYVDHDITTPVLIDSARNVWVRWVKNASGGALLPGVVCKAVLTSAATSKYHVDVWVLPTSLSASSTVTTWRLAFRTAITSTWSSKDQRR
jgi:hypothetical protein